MLALGVGAVRTLTPLVVWVEAPSLACLVDLAGLECLTGSACLMGWAAGTLPLRWVR